MLPQLNSSMIRSRDSPQPPTSSSNPQSHHSEHTSQTLLSHSDDPVHLSPSGRSPRTFPCQHTAYPPSHHPLPVQQTWRWVYYHGISCACRPSHVCSRRSRVSVDGIGSGECLSVVDGGMRRACCVESLRSQSFGDRRLELHLGECQCRVGL
jgi:hypothetical protein